MCTYDGQWGYWTPGCAEKGWSVAPEGMKAAPSKMYSWMCPICGKQHRNPRCKACRDPGCPGINPFPMRTLNHVASGTALAAYGALPASGSPLAALAPARAPASQPQPPSSPSAPSALQREPKGRAARRCWKCGELGHVSAQCPCPVSQAEGGGLPPGAPADSPDAGSGEANPAPAAARNGDGPAGQDASDSGLESSEDGRMELSPVRGMSLLDSTCRCTWSHGLLTRTITQRWRPC